MQFQVPQFIETEDKIIGPLTLKQFLYLAAAGAVSFILFFILQFWLWIVTTMVFGVIAATFAFIRYNGQPFAKTFLAAIGYAWNPKMYLWQREEVKLKVPETAALKIKVVKAQKEQRPRLKDLWLKITTSAQITPKTPAKSEADKAKYEMWRKVTGEKEMARRIDYR